jgi:hypothetical protein
MWMGSGDSEAQENDGKTMADQCGDFRVCSEIRVMLVSGERPE